MLMTMLLELSSALKIFLNAVIIYDHYYSVHGTYKYNKHLIKCFERVWVQKS